MRLTADGSSTLFVAELDEHYHSIHGALQESSHVFINAGLLPRTEEEIYILEFGLGTGLNAWLTAIEAERINKHINYLCLEKYPISSTEAQHLNYSSFRPDASNLFNRIHVSPWGERATISPHFKLTKIEADFLMWKPEKPKFHVIYFDAFAPTAQPELWQPELLQTCFDALNPGGYWVSYCAKGQLKRDLKSVGFEVESLPGPPGKRQMTRALKP